MTSKLNFKLQCLQLVTIQCQFIKYLRKGNCSSSGLGICMKTGLRILTMRTVWVMSEELVRNPLDLGRLCGSVG